MTTAQMIWIGYFVVSPFMILPLFVHFTLKFSNVVRLGEFIWMILVACFPFMNLVVLGALLFFVYDWNSIFDKVVFTRKVSSPCQELENAIEDYRS